jgi:hypothetical protein
MFALDGYRTRHYDLPVPAAREVAGTLSLRLYGNSNTDHQLQVYVNGEDVAWHADTAGTLYFYGQSIDSLFSATRTYWLSLTGNGEKMGVVDVTEAADVNATFIDQHDYEEEIFAVLGSTDDPAADYWFWDWMFALDGYRTRHYDLPVPAAREVAGSLSLRLYGNSNTDHQLRVYVNEEDIGLVEFTGNVTPPQTLDLPASVFAGAGDNLEVTLTLNDSPGGGLSSVFLDGFAVTYSRAYDAAGADSISYPAAGDTAVSGFSSNQVATLDITSPRHPAWVSGGLVTPGDGEFRYSANLPPGEYISSGPLELLEPVSVIIDIPSDLASKKNGADYVIITTDELWDGAESLAAYRSADLATMIVNQQDIFDEFAWGEPDPAAIQDLVRASRHWRTVPLYFVLLGDGSFDYQDRLGSGYNIIGPMMFGDSQGLHAGDTLLGDPDGTGKPVAAFGRIPVKTLEEVQDYLDKVEAFESTGFDHPGLLLTDKRGKAGDFKLSGQWVANEMAGNPHILDLEGSNAADVKEDLFTYLNQGVSLMNFIGHGGVNTVTTDGILLNDDADIHLNNSNTPAFVGLSCLINNYSVPDYDSIGERLVTRADAGMVVSWAASGESYNGAATQLGLAFNKRYKQHQRLGDAIIDSLSTNSELVTIYTLLGDPALKLRQ